MEWCGRAAAVGAMSTEPRRFRSRPVEVDAVRLNGRDNQLEVAVWCGGSPAEDGGVRTAGRMLAKPGHWIVRGTDGAHFPCPPGEFAASYQLVESDRVSAVKASMPATDGTVFAPDAFDHLTLPHTAPEA